LRSHAGKRAQNNQVERALQQLDRFSGFTRHTSRGFHYLHLCVK
jgi:hypothetical protein